MKDRADGSVTVPLRGMNVRRMKKEDKDLGVRRRWRADKDDDEEETVAWLPKGVRLQEAEKRSKKRVFWVN